MAPSSVGRRAGQFLTAWMAAGLAALAFGRPAAAELNVYAAASLHDVLVEIVAAWQAQGGEAIVTNSAGSNVLARQIEAGAPADVFLSADPKQMETLARRKLIDESSRVDLLTNRLVVVVNLKSPAAVGSAADLAGPAVRRLALADPLGVPAGVYAKRWLESIDLWPRLAGKVIPTENVRAALAAVAAGNVEAGIVYRTDAAASPAVRVAFEVPAAEAPAIVYPAAAIAGRPRLAAARKFVAYLSSAPSRALFTRHGFGLIPETDH